MSQQPQRPAQQGVFIDQGLFNQLTAAGIIAPGQPAQQIFQQPVQPPPPPASTMQAMQQQGWVQQGQPQRVTTPNMGMHAQGFASAPQQQAAPQPQQMAAPQAPRSQQELAAEVDQLINGVKEGVMNMFNNGNGNGQQNQGQGQQGPDFFDTTWGKATIGIGGVGVGVLGTKLIGNIFGGGGNNGVSANDANAIVNAFKTLLK